VKLEDRAELRVHDAGMFTALTPPRLRPKALNATRTMAYKEVCR
jgi:hypothetical protein